MHPGLTRPERRGGFAKRFGGERLPTGSLGGNPDPAPTSAGMIDEEVIRLRWEADGSERDERGRRLFAASEVRAAGRGGLAAVSSITGLARSTIERGLKDLDAPTLARGRVRREGGGRAQTMPPSST
jgi:hypothetical protein